MKKKLRSFTAVFLTVVLITSLFSIIPAQAVSDESQSACVSSGTTGDCMWTLDDKGRLTISGNGKMKDYSYDSDLPWGEDISLVIIEAGVTNIGDYAFYCCENLTSVFISGVTSIGNYAFCDCTALSTIDIPNSVTNIGYWTFGDCTSLTNVTIPDSVTSIGDRAFYGCTCLISVNIGNSVTSIGYDVFYDCIDLKSITIPDNVTSIEYMSLGYYFDFNSMKNKKVDGFAICGVKGSAAEKYANDYGFDFIEIEPEEKKIIGDVNGDNSVDILDATVVQKYSAGKENLSEEQLEVADVKNDNNVDILDATEIQKFAAGKITEFKKS